MKNSIFTIAILFLSILNSCNPKFECDKFGDFDERIFYNKIIESYVSYHEDKMSSNANSFEFFPDGTVSLYTYIDSLSFIRKGTFRYELILSDCYCEDLCMNPLPIHGGLGTISITESNDTVCDFIGDLEFEFYTTEDRIEIKIFQVDDIDCIDNILFCSKQSCWLSDPSCDSYEGCGDFKWISYVFDRWRNLDQLKH